MMANVFSLLKYVAILFVYSKFLQITGEAVNTTAFQTITEHTVDLNEMPTRPTTTFKEEIDNVENIKPTSSKASVHALNELNGITTPFPIDESLEEANIEQTQDPFVAQQNMTVQDLKQEKNKNEGHIIPIISATNIDTETKPEITESIKLQVTSTVPEIVTFYGEKTSFKSKDAFGRNFIDAVIKKPSIDSNIPIEMKQSTVLPNIPYEHFTSSGEMGNFKFTATLGKNKNGDTSSILSNSNTTPMGTNDELFSDTKTSTGVTTNFEHTQEDTSVFERSTKIKKSNHEENFGPTTLDTSQKTQTISEMKQSTVLQNLLHKHVTSSGEEGNFKTTATLVRYKNDDTSSVSSNYNTTPMGTNNLLLSDTKTFIGVTTILEHPQDETSVPFFEQNTKIKKQENEENFDQTTLETNVKSQTRSEMKQSTILPNIPFKHFTSSVEMENFKFTATLGKNKNEDTSSIPSNSNTTLTGTNNELFSDTKTSMGVTTNFEQDDKSVPFFEQNPKIQKSKHEENFGPTALDTSHKPHQTTSEMKQSTVLQNFLPKHVTSSGEEGYFITTATLVINKNDETSSINKTTLTGTNNELFSDTKTSVGETTSFEHTKDDTSVPFVKENTKINKSKNVENSCPTTFETRHETRTTSEMKESTLLPNILSEHFTSSGEKGDAKATVQLGINNNVDTSSIPSINNTTPMGTNNKLFSDTKTSMEVTTSFEPTQHNISFPFLGQNTEIKKSKNKENFGPTTIEMSHKTQTISEMKPSILLQSVSSEHFTSPGEKGYFKTSTALGIKRKEATSSIPSINNITPDNSTSNVSNDETSVTNTNFLSSGFSDDDFHSSGNIDYVTTTAQTSIVNRNVKSSNGEIHSERKHVTDIRNIISKVATTTTEEFKAIFAGKNAGNSNTASKPFITSAHLSTLFKPRLTSIHVLPIATVPTITTTTRRPFKTDRVSLFNIQFEVEQEKLKTKSHQTSPVTPASTIFDDERSRNHQRYPTKRKEKTYTSIELTPSTATSFSFSTTATDLATKLGSSNALSLSTSKYYIHILIIFIVNMFVI